MSKRILVTGATGFIGTNLTKRLIDNDYTVSVLCRNIDNAKIKFGDKVIYIEGDVSDPKSLAGCCEGIDIVYHMAAIMGHDLPGDEAFSKFHSINVDGTKNIAAEAGKSTVKRFIYVSSTAAIGLVTESLVDESTMCNPWTPYQVSKRESELFLLGLIKSQQFPAVIVRPSMIYGPGFKGDFLTIAKAGRTGFFPKIGLGKNLSPALYIDDLIEPLVTVGIKEDLKYDLYIISSEESYALDRVVSIISKSMGKKVRLVYIPKWCALLGASVIEVICRMFGRKPPVSKRNIKSVVQDRTFSVKRAKEDLDYIQEVSIEEGLTNTIQYFKEQKYL